jgi:hypothetical protein
MTLTYVAKLRRADSRRARKILLEQQWPKSFEEYERNCDRQVAEIRARGDRIEVVDLDLDQFLDFCAFQGLKPDSQARAIFATMGGMSPPWPKLSMPPRGH